MPEEVQAHRVLPSPDDERVYLRAHETQPSRKVVWVATLACVAGVFVTTQAYSKQATSLGLWVHTNVNTNLGVGTAGMASRPVTRMNDMRNPDSKPTVYGPEQAHRDAARPTAGPAFDSARPTINPLPESAPEWKFGTLASSIQVVMRVGLVAAAGLMFLPKLKGGASQPQSSQWAMASVDSSVDSDNEEPPKVDKPKSTIDLLDDLFGDDEEKDEPAPAAKPAETTPAPSAAVSSTPAAPAGPKTKVQSAVSGLEALFGPDEAELEAQREAEKAEKERKERAVRAAAAADMASLSPEEKAARLKEAEDKLAAKIANVDSRTEMEDVRLQAEELLEMAIDSEVKQRRVPREDVNLMKNEILKPSLFYVTCAEEAKEFPSTGFVGGHLFRGNLREDRDKVFEEVSRKTKEIFKGKYDLLIIEEPPDYDSDELGARSKPDRPAFLLIAASQTKAEETTTLQWALSFLLIFATVVTTYLTAFGVGLSEVDTTQIQAMAEVQNTAAIEELLELNIGDISRVAVPIGAGIISSAVAHELGHRFAAARNKVKLGPPFYLPSMTIGSLGSITQLKELAPNKATLFDIAASGPVAGGTSALVFFLTGLFFSVSASAGDPTLIPLSKSLLESSLLLGGIARGLLGSGEIQCHPFLIAGWCGLVATALNSLPLGSTDGGRIMRSVFGEGARSTASFLTYLFLGLGFLAPGLGLTWGLTVIFLQRGVEKNLRDQFTPVDEQRKLVARAILILAVLILLPSGEAFMADGGGSLGQLPLIE